MTYTVCFHEDISLAYPAEDYGQSDVWECNYCTAQGSRDQLNYDGQAQADSVDPDLHIPAADVFPSEESEDMVNFAVDLLREALRGW